MFLKSVYWDYGVYKKYNLYSEATNNLETKETEISDPVTVKE